MSRRLKAAALAAATALGMVALTPAGAGATFPGNNGRIAFTKGSFEGRTFIASMEPDGSDVVRLTGKRRPSFGPSWSPDGSRFIYSFVRRGGSVDLYLRDADGSNKVRVTESRKDEFQVAFGPDGNQAVFQKCFRQCDLFTIDLTTGDLTRLTKTRADEIAPNWGVNNRIVFERVPRRGDADIFSLNTANGREQRLTDNKGAFDGSASWSPNGSQIVFSRCSARTDCELFTMNRNGTNKQQVTDNNRDEFFGRFSPDGNSFVVARSRGEGTADLFLLNLDGTVAQRLTSTPNRFEVDPDWQAVP